MNLANLFASKKVVYSLEVFPPKVTSSIDTIYNTLYGLRGLPADFISVTYGAGGSQTQKDKTLEIASLIKSEYNIEPLFHLTCLNSDRAEIETLLSRFEEHGIENILALRGDASDAVQPKHEFAHASDLVGFLKEKSPNLNVVGACYPEGHCDAESLNQDIDNLKYKLEAGASHLITQLFFDNDQFYRFYEKALAAGIQVPIQAGIMPIVRKTQIERIVSMCGASIPPSFARLVNKYADDPEALFEAGVHYATQQMIDLLANDVRGLHLYTMNNVKVAKKITTSIEALLKSSNK